MKERPILFTPENAQKCHDGTKTQTRRIIKQKHLPFLESLLNGLLDGKWNQRPLPYGVVGDRLWIREAVAYIEEDLVAYKADGSCGAWIGDGSGGRFWLPHGWIQGFSTRDGQYFGLSKYGGKWKPSLHMPRWACRTVLELTELRVERLQDISQADAIAEGAPPSHPSIDKISREYGYKDFPRSWYAQLWESINGEGSWALNPWVWVLTFKKITG